MKKVYYSLVLSTILAFSAHAGTHNVAVSDNIFTPDNMIVMVGDTIIWTWQEGNHTTTSTSVPGGAASWDADMNAASPMYTYIVAVPGTYEYQCDLHPLMMLGQFTAMESSAIGENAAGIRLNLNLNPSTGRIIMDLKSSSAGTLEIGLNDLTGRQVRMLASGHKGAGEHHFEFDVADLPKGMYLVKLSIDRNEVLRKIVIQ